MKYLVTVHYLVTSTTYEFAALSAAERSYERWRALMDDPENEIVVVVLSEVERKRSCCAHNCLGCSTKEGL